MHVLKGKKGVGRVVSILVQDNLFHPVKTVSWARPAACNAPHNHKSIINPIHIRPRYTEPLVPHRSYLSPNPVALFGEQGRRARDQSAWITILHIS